MIERKVFEGQVKEFDDAELSVVHFISTERQDRGGDIMRVDGMHARGRVVVLHSHGRGEMGSEPVAKPLWVKPGVFKGERGLMAKTQFYDGSGLTPPDNTGKRLYEKAKGGFMPNWSIGYVPEEWKDIDQGRGRDVTKWELLEYSCVGVPMQPDAQTLDFKMAGDDGSEIEEKPYPSEHACRVNDPGKYKRFRRQNDKFGAGIHAIFGIVEGGKTEVQAIRFDASKFTPAEAKRWAKDNDFSCMAFEPASGKEAPCDCNDDADVERKTIMDSIDRLAAAIHKDVLDTTTKVIQDCMGELFQRFEKALEDALLLRAEETPDASADPVDGKDGNRDAPAVLRIVQAAPTEARLPCTAEDLRKMVSAAMAEQLRDLRRALGKVD